MSARVLPLLLLLAACDPPCTRAQLDQVKEYIQACRAADLDGLAFGTPRCREWAVELYCRWHP